MSTVNVPLKNPLTTHKGVVNSLDINEATARSFIEHGEPFKARKVGESVEIDFNNKAMIGFLVDMTGVDSIILGTLKSNDYFALRNAAVALIVGSAGDTPTQA